MDMPLHYLDFDFSDEASGRGSFDAMASVLPDRLPALLEEIAAVLRWAVGLFGDVPAAADEGEWDFELQGVADPGIGIDVNFDARAGEVLMSPATAGGRITLTLTLSGSRAFCDALRDRFELG